MPLMTLRCELMKGGDLHWRIFPYQPLMTEDQRYTGMFHLFLQVCKRGEIVTLPYILVLFTRLVDFIQCFFFYF